MPGLFENPAAAWFVDSKVILLNTGPEQADPLPYLIIRVKSSYTEPEQTSASSFTGPKQAATRFVNLKSDSLTVIYTKQQKLIFHRNWSLTAMWSYATPQQTINVVLIRHQQ